MLSAGNYRAMLERFTSPSDLDEMRKSGRLDQVVARFKDGWGNVLMKKLKLARTTVPIVNKDGTITFAGLDYRSLVEKFLRSKDQLVRVCYFSAHAYWNPGKVQRHKLYLRALRSVGIDVVLGEFKRKERRCHHCHRLNVHPEEKRTE
jgi:hypothetical protein